MNNRIELVSHKRKPYTNDLSDEHWEKVRVLLPLERRSPGRPIEIDMCEVVNAILYNKTSSQWENLPNDFPNYQSVYYHMSSPSECGHHRQSKCDNNWSRWRAGLGCGGKVKGRKRHILVDTLGHLVKVIVHPADIHDRDRAKLLLTSLLLMMAARFCIVSF